MITRPEIEEQERQRLAGYAALAAETRGRVYPQPLHPLRTEFQRDRDRIVHSAAFRRMEHKTQVFIPRLADHFRTRLTHTIEVAQISRSLARNLSLNEDLTEAIALVHDLGHTPFGHAGEDALGELLKDHGGFNHNRQSARVVDLLEQRYADHPGLNLTYEVREGIAKHETRDHKISDEFHPGERPTLEASLVDEADSLAYTAHDIDDGLNSGLITLDDISELSIWEGNDSPLADMKPFGATQDDEMRYRLVRYLINRLATDLLNETSTRLMAQNISDMTSLRNAKMPICVYSDEMQPRFKELKQFLRSGLYHHPRLTELSKRAHDVISYLYEELTFDPMLMPQRFQAMLVDEKKEIVAADYIAGMTDRFAERLVEELSSKT